MSKSGIRLGAIATASVAWREAIQKGLTRRREERGEKSPPTPSREGLEWGWGINLSPRGRKWPKVGRGNLLAVILREVAESTAIHRTPSCLRTFA
jgi:hypothetical protein